jgi:hypothetical protein
MRYQTSNMFQYRVEFQRNNSAPIAPSSFGPRRFVVSRCYPRHLLEFLRMGLRATGYLAKDEPVCTPRPRTRRQPHHGVPRAGDLKYE